MGIPSPTGIQGDPALTSYGIDQAKELGRHLGTLNPAVEKVYSSPFYRCLQTMVPFMDLQREKLGAQNGQRPRVPAGESDETAKSLLTGTVVTKMLPEHGIREWFGSAPFDHPEPAAPGVLKAMFPSYDESYTSAARPSSKGEILEQLQQRITKALRGIIQQCDDDGTRAIVLCSHAAVIILIGRILTGLIPASVDVDDFQPYTCGLSVYSRSSGGVAEGSNISDTRDDRHPTSSSTPGTYIYACTLRFQENALRSNKSYYAPRPVFLPRPEPFFFLSTSARFVGPFNDTMRLEATYPIVSADSRYRYIAGESDRRLGL
ncbi:C6 zinc cluster transcription factor-like protein [Metarhizium acridum]|nr:C6 zinc cluster transcription factor-like protein [Metarhizium acridum]